MSTTTGTTIETPNPASTEALKSAWHKLNPTTPEGWSMTLYFDGHYSHSMLAGKPWEYVGVKWKVSLSEGSSGNRLGGFAYGDGDTPEAAMTAAIADMYSKQRAVKARELGEFKEWRAARERKGDYMPHDRDGWDKAVSETPSEDDD